MKRLETEARRYTNVHIIIIIIIIITGPSSTGRLEGCIQGGGGQTGRAGQGRGGKQAARAVYRVHSI